MVRTSIDSLIVLPTVTGYRAKSTLEDLSSKVAKLQALAHPLKDRPELMDTLQGISKDLTSLLERYHTDNPDDKTSVSKDVKSSAVSKFDRLPRLELSTSMVRTEDGVHIGKSSTTCWKRISHLPTSIDCLSCS